MPDITKLESVLSIDVCYDHYDTKTSQVLEANTVRINFADIENATKFGRALVLYDRDRMFSVSPAFLVYDNEGNLTYCMQLSVNRHAYTTGKRGADILDLLYRCFSQLPNSISVSREDGNVPGAFVKNIVRLPAADRQLLRHRISELQSMMKAMNPIHFEQIATLCGSPVKATIMDGITLQLDCVDEGAAESLRLKLFERANKLRKYHLIGFMDYDNPSSFFLLIQRGLTLGELVNFNPAPRAASSNERLSLPHEEEERPEDFARKHITSSPAIMNQLLGLQGNPIVTGQSNARSLEPIIESGIIPDITVDSEAVIQLPTGIVEQLAMTPSTSSYRP